MYARTNVALRCSLLALSVAGCAKPEFVSLRSLADAGGTNELQLAEDFEGKEVEIRGIVMRVGQDRRELFEHEFVFTEDFAVGESHRRAERIPFAMLAPDDGRGGVAAVCYFEPEQRGEAATLSRGSVANLTGRFSSYQENRNLPTLVLQDCALAD